MKGSQVLDVMLKSRADATAKAYMRVIKRFLDWCKSGFVRYDDLCNIVPKHIEFHKD